MAKIFITGSSDGLGQLAAKSLIEQGHDVVLHARNEQRAKETKQNTPGAKDVLIAELSNPEQTKRLAHDVNRLGRFDAVIHNAGVYQTSTATIFAVNTLAPYILTALIEKPGRLIYLSSGMHLSGHFDPRDFRNCSTSYSNSKLHMVILAKALARKWPDVYANALDPGWVPTKMGGKGAPDDLKKGFDTQVWLAVSNDPAAEVSGKYFFHQKQSRNNRESDDETAQDQLLELYAALTGITLS
jgi:NAD(P)-dependent dehydrogenase (short-subunit alcohol dehydrogenase family)